MPINRKNKHTLKQDNKVHVVICHYNNPLHLQDSINIISNKDSEDSVFYIIDNSSTKENLEKVESILSKSEKKFEIHVRENVNREAGAYWFYINQIFSKLSPTDRPSVIFFTQEELHQYPMFPKGRFSTEKNPFYPHHYRDGGISLARMCVYLNKYTKDQVGFGGRIEKVDKGHDHRWKAGYWPNRWKSLGIENYLYFSGACFAVHHTMMEKYQTVAMPTQEDLRNEHFPWMWERMWGTIPHLNGGKLVHYKDFSTEVMIDIPAGESS